MTRPIFRLAGDLGDRLSTFTQRWIPDSWVVCMILTVVAILLAIVGAGAGLYGDSTTNLIQLFWAIPILTVTRLRFGDVLGYTGLVALVCLTVNLIGMFLIPVGL